MVTWACSGASVVEGRRRDRLEDRLEQRLEVVLLGHAAVLGPLQRRAAGLGRGVDDRELDLVLVGVEVEEQLVGLVDDLGDARVRTVDLVDDQDDRHPGLERLAQHEAGLRQRPLGGVDQQQHAVDHRQPALDLAAEVGVARGVDDVDREPLAGGHHVIDGRVLGQDRDALLPLEVVGVHDALVDVAGVGLVCGERPGLPQHGVDEGGLAVVDVRDDRHVAQVVARGDRHAATLVLLVGQNFPVYETATRSPTTCSASPGTKLFAPQAAMSAAAPYCAHGVRRGAGRPAARDRRRPRPG